MGILALPLFSQQQQLDVTQIMQDPASWIGTSPSRISWSWDSKKIYFQWNPDQLANDSLYMYTIENQRIEQVSKAERLNRPRSLRYNVERNLAVFEQNGDLYILALKTGERRPIAITRGRERFVSFDDTGENLFFQQSNNVFHWRASDGLIRQLTDFRKGQDTQSPRSGAENEEWIKQEEKKLIQILAERADARTARQEAREAEKAASPKPIFLGSANLDDVNISPDGRFIGYRLEHRANAKRTEVPAYVDASGFTKGLNARPKVGSPQNSYSSFLYDTQQDTVIKLVVDSLPGVKQAADFLADYGKETDLDQAKSCMLFGPYWSDDSRHAVVVVRSQDFKDRWIAKIDLQTGILTALDHQHDEAWIGGPGIVRWLSAGNVGWMPDQQRFWFQSEETGYSHLYCIDVSTAKKKALTKGKYEIYNPRISNDQERWYFHSNATHPGVRHFFAMPIEGGKTTQLTQSEGGNQVSLSPDEKMLAIRHSTATQPWELFLQANKAQASATQITKSQTETFSAYPWRMPDFVTFKAEDGKDVHARVYQADPPNANGAAVIFVHGAGYLQNAHKWWSSYFREYMFHNLLVEKGYTVLDMDFRASAGYGRDWRTAVYRDMGGKDLSDQVDGANFLVEKYNIDPKRIGIYGGSYGGFISLMAMFNEGDIFACGAALRPVTDWAHYNHPYTGSMLNLPQDDSLAYVRSSPIYHAEGLQGPLLICHGMIDTNVHFQDVVRLTQRLIELGKNDWEVAIFPLEGHGFREPSSWADEYKRILKLFETHLK